MTTPKPDALTSKELLREWLAKWGWNIAPAAQEELEAIIGTSPETPQPASNPMPIIKTWAQTQWERIPVTPNSQPGSYARGYDGGMLDILRGLRAQLERLPSETSARPYTEVMKKTEREGVDAQDLIATLMKKVEDQRREVARLNVEHRTAVGLKQVPVTDRRGESAISEEGVPLCSAQETGAPHTTEDDFAHWLSYSGKGNRATAEQLRDWREAYFAGVEPTLKAGTGQCYLHPESTCPTPCQGGRKCVLEPAKANAQSFEVRNGPAQETPECRMTPVPAEPSNYPKPGAAQKATVRYPGMQICRKYTQNGPCLNEIDHQGECDGLPHL